MSLNPSDWKDRSPLARAIRAASGPIDDRAGMLPAIAILGAVLALSLARCFYGVDFTDEAQYVAQAYAPTIGGMPFEADHFIQQSASLLFVPLVRIFTQVQGSTEGLVLFFRFFWWLAAGGTSILLFTRLRGVLGPLRAAAVSLFPVLFIPFGIPSPSYNTLGTLLLTIGLCSRNVAGAMELSALGLAAICYPPFIVAGIGTLAAARNIRRTALFLGGLGLCGVFALMVFGWSRIHESLVFTSSFGTFGGLQKLEIWYRELEPILPTTVPVALGWIVLLVSATYLPWEQFFLPFISCVLLCHGLIQLPTHFWVAIIAVGGLPLTLRKTTVIPRSLVLLSILCGCISGWASSNGFWNVSIGILPAFVAALTEWTAASRSTPRARAIQGLALFALVAAFTLQLREVVYRDGRFDSLTERVSSGPYKGLRTTPAKSRILATIEADVRETTGHQGSILFMYDFPAGYLFSDMRPASKMLFMQGTAGYPDAVREILIPKSPRDVPDWIVRIKNFPGDVELERRIAAAGHYQVALDRREYVILKNTP